MSRVWASFWTPKRQRAYPVLLVGILLIWWAVFTVFRAATNERYGADFVVFYSASELTLGGKAETAYDPATIFAHEVQVSSDSDASPFRYPPPFLLVLAPLALLPYGLALASWLGLTALALAAAVRESVRAWWAFPLAVFPAAAVNIMAGQNGFLTAALIGGGLPLLDRRPRVAGMLLGALMYKPQFLGVALLGLLVGRRWKALIWACGCVAALTVVSYLAFGPDAWEGFRASGQDSVDWLYEPSIADHRVSALAFGVLFGLSRPAAQALHVLVASLTLVLVVRVWIKDTRPALRNSVTVLATLLVSPYVFIYDLAMLIPVAGWLVHEARERGWPRSQPLLLGICLSAPLWSWILAAVSGVQLGWVTLAALAVSVTFGLGFAHRPSSRLPIRPEDSLESNAKLEIRYKS